MASPGAPRSTSLTTLAVVGGGSSAPPPAAATASTAPVAAVAATSTGDLAALRARVWAVMDDPTSSRAAQLVAGGILAVILVSCTAFVLQTLPQYAGETSAEFAGIELACVIIFSVEFALRVSCTPSLVRFAASPLNIVDFLAILPFYVELALGSDNSGSQVIRIVRLVRIFRIFKVSRYLPWVRVFTNALALSLQPLVMLVLVVGIAVVLFSSVMYYAERGEWSDAEGAWMRPASPGGGGGGGPVPSPFQSIPATFWWCIVTMTTVGYGDVYPVTPAGRFIAALASLSGILVVAIPVSVISTNFTGEYGKLLRQRAQVRARLSLLRRQFRGGRAGLDAVLDEVDDIVERNTAELEGEVGALFAQARAELAEEVGEVLKMAYERRRQLHLAALAGGRVQTSG